VLGRSTDLFASVRSRLFCSADSHGTVTPARAMASACRSTPSGFVLVSVGFVRAGPGVSRVPALPSLPASVPLPSSVPEPFCREACSNRSASSASSPVSGAGASVSSAVSAAVSASVPAGSAMIST